MKIGIDARFVGPQGTGLGKYTEKLILNLTQLDKKNKYVIFLRQENWNYLNLTNHNNFTKVFADVPWYSVMEQTKMPQILNSQNLDLLHVPHFNAPIFYRKKFIVTIHDLIHHKFSETSATTKNPIIFKLKRFGYTKVIENAIYKSQKIITPSKFVKEDIAKNFNLDPKKITVTYEAAEEEYFNNKTPHTTSQNPTLLYVGNAYPHKNLNNLLDAIKILILKFKIDNFKLIIVSPRDVFSKRLEAEIENRGLKEKVELKGYLAPNELSKLFQKSTAYVFPSLSEGFGIPGLNAMASNLPLIASDIPVLKEIYGAAPLYFNPNDPEDIAQKIKTVLSNDKLRNELAKKGLVQSKKYSWQKMAQETLNLYESV